MTRECALALREACVDVRNALCLEGGEASVTTCAIDGYCRGCALPPVNLTREAYADLIVGARTKVYCDAITAEAQLGLPPTSDEVLRVAEAEEEIQRVESRFADAFRARFADEAALLRALSANASLCAQLRTACADAVRKLASSSSTTTVNACSFSVERAAHSQLYLGGIIAVERSVSTYSRDVLRKLVGESGARVDAAAAAAAAAAVQGGGNKPKPSVSVVGEAEVGTELLRAREAASRYVLRLRKTNTLDEELTLEEKLYSQPEVAKLLWRGPHSRLERSDDGFWWIGVSALDCSSRDLHRRCHLVSQSNMHSNPLAVRVWCNHSPGDAPPSPPPFMYGENGYTAAPNAEEHITVELHPRTAEEDSDGDDSAGASAERKRFVAVVVRFETLEAHVHRMKEEERVGQVRTVDTGRVARVCLLFALLGGGALSFAAHSGTERSYVALLCALLLLALLITAPTLTGPGIARAFVAVRGAPSLLRAAREFVYGTRADGENTHAVAPVYWYLLIATAAVITFLKGAAAHSRERRQGLRVEIRTGHIEVDFGDLPSTKGEHCTVFSRTAIEVCLLPWLKLLGGLSWACDRARQAMCGAAAPTMSERFVFVIAGEVVVQMAWLSAHTMGHAAFFGAYCLAFAGWVLWAVRRGG